MTTLADPDTRFPGLPDGTAASVAAVVEARTAGLWVLVAHLRDGGCPFPNSLDVMASVVTRVERLAWETDWTAELRDVVLDACSDVEGLIKLLRKVTR